MFCLFSVGSSWCSGAYCWSQCWKILSSGCCDSRWGQLLTWQLSSQQTDLECASDHILFCVSDTDETTEAPSQQQVRDNTVRGHNKHLHRCCPCGICRSHQFGKWLCIIATFLEVKAFHFYLSVTAYYSHLFHSFHLYLASLQPPGNVPHRPCPRRKTA